MSNEGIEVKLVLDVDTLGIPDVSDIVDDVTMSSSFENAVDSMCEGWFENSNVYYHEDRLDTLESRIDDMESESNDEDNEELEALTVRHFALKDRVNAIEEKLSTEPEASEDSLSVLALRVKRLEQINERLLHIIHNVQGVDLP